MDGIAMLPTQQYRASAKGREFRAVVCENCQSEFVYLLSCQAEGGATGVILVDADSAARAGDSGVRRQRSAADGIAWR